MKNLKIVFMGTPDFAVGILDTLIQNKYNVVGIVTAPDKPAGRGRRINESAVKKYANDLNIPILQPTNLKSDEFITQLKNLEADIQIVVAFRMLPKQVWQMPPMGTFNLHASLLPDYRGAAPINWAIINGETQTGVTTFFIDEKIDTGAIILSKKMTITPEENVGELHDKLLNIGKSAVTETLDLIEQGDLKTIIQPDKSTKTAYKLNKDNTRINWELSGDKINDFIRGLSPYPAAWTLMSRNNKEESVKIFKATYTPNKHNVSELKTELTKNEVLVYVPNGIITILELQVPGKRKCSVRDFLNGLQNDTKIKFY